MALFGVIPARLPGDSWHHGVSLANRRTFGRSFPRFFSRCLFVSGVDHSVKTKQLLERSRFPIVEAMDLADHPIGINVGFSHYKVGVAVAEYFHQKGYKRIAYAGTLTEIDLRSVKRIAGFQQTLKDFGYRTISSNVATNLFPSGRPQVIRRAAAPASGNSSHFFRERRSCCRGHLRMSTTGIRVPGQFAIWGLTIRI